MTRYNSVCTNVLIRVLYLQTTGGNNDYVSIAGATRSQRSSRLSSVIETRASTNDSRSHAHDNIAIGSRMANENIADTESDDYEILRQDARVNQAVRSENPYLCPVIDTETSLLNREEPHSVSLYTQGVDEVLRININTALPNEVSYVQHQHHLAASVDVGAPLRNTLTPSVVVEAPTITSVCQPGVASSNHVRELIRDDTGLQSRALQSAVRTNSNPTSTGAESDMCASFSDEQPPAYSSDKVLEVNVNSPLKVRQFTQLKDEMARPDGVSVILSKSNCHTAVALVDYVGKVW